MSEAVTAGRVHIGAGCQLLVRKGPVEIPDGDPFVGSELQTCRPDRRFGVLADGGPERGVFRPFLDERFDRLATHDHPSVWRTGPPFYSRMTVGAVG